MSWKLVLSAFLVLVPAVLSQEFPCVYQDESSGAVYDLTSMYRNPRQADYVFEIPRSNHTLQFNLCGRNKIPSKPHSAVSYVAWENLENAFNFGRPDMSSVKFLPDNQGLVISYSGGSICPQSANPTRTSSSVELLCDKSARTPVIEARTSSCHVNIQVRTIIACPL